MSKHSGVGYDVSSVELLGLDFRGLANQENHLKPRLWVGLLLPPAAKQIGF